MNRRNELDWVRTAAMLGVVMIHVSAGFIARDSRFSLPGGVTPALFCNQAARAAVPIFFLLSGLSLGLSKKPIKLPGFWLRRFWKVGLPYVVWTLFYFLLNKGFRLEVFRSSAAWWELGWHLILGGAEAHLWFVPPLLELYLLYPLLRLLMDRKPFWTLLAGLLITLFCTLVIVAPLPLTGWWRPHLWRMFPIWLFYFLLGMSLTESRLDRLRTFCRRHALPLLLLGAAAAFVYCWDAVRRGNLDAVRIPLFLYTPAALAFLLAVWRYLERIPGSEKAVRCLADGSMTVYFSHVFFLRYLSKYPFYACGTLGMLGMFLAAAVMSIVFAGLLGRLTKCLKRRRSDGTSAS